MNAMPDRRTPASSQAGSAPLAPAATLDAQRPRAEEESLADRAAAVLTAEIVAGTLRPGQWVSENELAARLGVSRSPVREALRSLARDGLVAVQARRGTVISELSATEVAELYAARQLVESEMVRLATAALREEDIRELAAIVASAKSADLDHRAYYDTVWAAWELLADHCPNRALRDLTTLLWRRSIPLRGMLVALPGNRELMNNFLDRLLDACSASDGEAAAAIMRESLGDTCGRVLAECFIDTGQGEPIRRRPLT
jgi:DNA-binding GntR family transcriptional regulator